MKNYSGNFKIINQINSFIYLRNFEKKRVDTRNIMLFGISKGYTKKEVGFALRELRNEYLIGFTKKYGWVSR